MTLGLGLPASGASLPAAPPWAGPWSQAWAQSPLLEGVSGASVIAMQGAEDPALAPARVCFHQGPSPRSAVITLGGLSALR